jgi:hypothetical protein
MGRHAINSMPDSSLDEIVILVDSKWGQNQANARLRRIEYKSPIEIFQALGYEGKVPSNLRAQAASFVPSSLRKIQPPPSHIATSNPQTAVDVVDEDVDVKPENVDDIIESIPANSTAGLLSAAENEDRNRAASVFIRLYRRSLRRRANNVLTGIPTTRAAQITKCFNEVGNIEWASNSHYRRIFLGPLPHLLTCVETLIAKAHAEKNKIKIKVGIAEHEIYETLMGEQTKISYVGYFNSSEASAEY